ncbi:hypothetical protein 32HC_51 [Mycobacterium phage 32HC]|uniref:HTH DNA binding protein n=1 Tax=Mycobacterium phage 32HC TaxID=1445729 RepID=W8E8U0_9CAUD|nr:hypothetical protein ST32HC_51 [Mycobacterium phage 32HC]AHJ86329.1 hypothetical protein 32HC_51 [Mycobacterium phage 32HC]
MERKPASRQMEVNPLSDPQSTEAPCRNCGQMPKRRKRRRGLCERCYTEWHDNAVATGTFVSHLVEVEPVQEHIDALLKAGRTLREISQQAGVEQRRVLMIYEGRAHRGKKRRTHVYRRTADAILAIEVPGDVVAALGTVRRIQALVTIGHPFFELARRLDVDDRELERIATRQPTIVSIELDEKIRALYGELAMIPGKNGEARQLGRRMQWAAPFAWDDDADLDNAAAKPAGVPSPPRGPKPTIPPDFPEMVADHRAAGRTDAEIAAFFDLTIEALKKRYAKFGIEWRAVAS